MQPPFSWRACSPPGTGNPIVSVLAPLVWHPGVYSTPVLASKDWYLEPSKPWLPLQYHHHTPKSLWCGWWWILLSDESHEPALLLVWSSSSLGVFSWFLTFLCCWLGLFQMLQMTQNASCLCLSTLPWFSRIYRRPSLEWFVKALGWFWSWFDQNWTEIGGDIAVQSSASLSSVFFHWILR